jgi:hypothetical protein
MLLRDQVTVARTGRTSRGLVDPEHRKIYLPQDVDIVRGDVAAFRDFSRRIDKPVEEWLGAGKVVEFEEGPPYLPDLGKLIRNAHFTTDYDTGDRILTAGDVLWTGPCYLESDPYAFDTRTDIGAQMVGSSVFLIKLPLEVVDIKDGDSFQTTTSRDGRLLVRTLTVKSARASTSDLFRQLLAFDNQGD